MSLFRQLSLIYFIRRIIIVNCALFIDTWFISDCLFNVDYLSVEVIPLIIEVCTIYVAVYQIEINDYSCLLSSLDLFERFCY